MYFIRRMNHAKFSMFLMYFAAYRTTTILLDGKRVKLQLWDTSGQGRFCTIIRSYSRGAQGILLVYDITNKWSFDGIDRWLKEVEEVSFETMPFFTIFISCDFLKILRGVISHFWLKIFISGFFWHYSFMCKYEF